MVSIEDGRVWHRGDRKAIGMQGWDRQSVTVLSVRDVRSLPAGSHHLCFSWLPGGESVALLVTGPCHNTYTHSYAMLAVDKGPSQYHCSPHV